MNLTLTILSTIAAVVSAIGAYGAWLAAKRSTQVAHALAQIEMSRRHGELTPVFTFELSLDPGHGQQLLNIILKDNPELDHLDKVLITIRDDIPNRERFAHTSPSLDIKGQIWGPLRFTPTTDGASKDGRTVAPFDLPVGESRRFAVEPSLPPDWNPDAAAWHDDYDGKPLRLTLECSREGFEPWTLRYEVHRDPTPQFTQW